MELTRTEDVVAGAGGTLEDEVAEALAELPGWRLGQLASAHRRAAGVGERSAAHVAGIDVKALEDIEDGRRLPDPRVLAALLKLYRVGYGEFFARREPLVIPRPDATSAEILHAYVDLVREWRRAGRKGKLRFREGDVQCLARLLGTDPPEIERRLIALTGCSRTEAKLLRKWFLAALVTLTLPLAYPLGGQIVATATAAVDHRAVPITHTSGAHAARASVAHASAAKLVWDDEFTGPAGTAPDPSKWQAVTGGNGWGNQELEYYTARPSNVSLDGAGHLAITARRETYTDASGVTRDYTSARIQTKGLFQGTYGQIEARIKLPAGQGLWPAFWALGADGSWPNAGEIDVMENIGSDPFTIFGSIHGPQSDAPHGYGLTTAEHSPVSLAAGFHTYGVTWSPNKIVFTLDGVPYSTRTPASLSSTQGWVFNKPFYLLLNMAVGGTWGGTPSASTAMPATMLVDWVRVYAQSGS